jgi:glycerophosphoryl diester phosphodiesterase
MSNVSKTILDRILCPVFQIQEYNDPTVFYSSGVRAFRKIASTYKKLYTTKLNTHLTIYDKGLECSVFCKIKQFLSEIEEHKFVNIAHRGASGTCTENTLSAFEKAIEYNCDMVEFDVQYIDRKLCVFHDYTANRMFGVDKKMSDLNSGEFDKLIYANCERIPTLQQALDCINGRCGVNIEVKDSSIATNIVAIVRDYQKKKQWRNVDIVLSSFSCATVNLIRRSDSDINVSQLFHEDNVTLRDIKNFKKDYFEKNIYSVNLYVEDITQPIVEYCNENSMKIYVYTVNELRAIRFLRELGVNGVFTDYPERIQ